MKILYCGDIKEKQERKLTILIHVIIKLNKEKKSCKTKQ